MNSDVYVCLMGIPIVGADTAYRAARRLDFRVAEMVDH